MKGKKPLLLAVLVVALLAVALIVPAVASGKQGSPNPNQPVNWVKGNFNTGNTDPDSHIGFTMNVKQGVEPTDIKGFVLQKIMRTLPDTPEDPNPFAYAPVVRRTTEFWPEDTYWAGVWPSTGLIPPYLANYARFCASGSSDFAWPWPPSGLPAGWLFPPSELPDDLDDANIADFIVYLQADFIWPYLAPWFLWNPDPEEDDYPNRPWYTTPHRYLIVDYDDPEKEDLVQIYGWLGIPFPPLNGMGVWWPQLGEVVAGEVPEYDLLPVPADCFRVHVGESTPLPDPLFPPGP